MEGATVNAVAERAGVIQTTLNRQLKAESLSPETVVSIARAYGVDVLSGLVAAGLITPDDIKRHGVHAALRDAFDADIAAEVFRRLGDGGQHGILEAPLT